MIENDWSMQLGCCWRRQNKDNHTKFNQQKVCPKFWIFKIKRSIEHLNELMALTMSHNTQNAISAFSLRYLCAMRWKIFEEFMKRKFRLMFKWFQGMRRSRNEGTIRMVIRLKLPFKFRFNTTAIALLRFVETTFCRNKSNRKCSFHRPKQSIDRCKL